MSIVEETQMGHPVLDTMDSYAQRSRVPMFDQYLISFSQNVNSP